MRVGFWCMVTILAALSSPLAGHQQKEAITRVLFNERTGNIEVMHRFLLHDAEHACKQLFDASADLLGNAGDREQFADYVHRQFAMLDQTGEEISLTPVGSEIDTQYLWVYAEAPIPKSLTRMRLTHDALRELWPEQTNMVNVERGKDVRTATFRSGSAGIEIVF
ncbi:MAG: DUF6702 family protein [Pseudomonadota bacterium]